MANGYRMQNVIEGNLSTIAIGASAVDTVVTEVFPISAADSLNLTVRIKIDQTASAKEVTGISFSLQHAYTDEEWEKVGSQATTGVAAVTAADADVDSGAETVTSASHPFDTGDAVYYTSASAITGLTTATVYYIIDATANTFKLATTRANAVAGTAINITQPAGAAAHYFTSVEPVEIQLNIQNSSDEAQLPLFTKARVVANSGASDAITISGVFVTRRV